MAKGFDCATPLTASLIASFKAQGYTFAGRYLADAASWKRLSPEEAKALSEAGLHVVSLFERYANRVREGAGAGAVDGRLALQYAREVGQPPGSAIYAAVDYDAPASDYDAIEAYMRAFATEIAGYELGVYGSYAVVRTMHERGVSTKLMQTYAWSKGQRYAPISIYQYENDVRVNGIGIDRCESDGNAGGWRKGMVNATSSLAPEIAQTIIETWLQPAWQEADQVQRTKKAEGDAEGSAELEKQKNYYHWLANSLRDAAGLPRE